jgi:hypothetical protein
MSVASIKPSSHLPSIIAGALPLCRSRELRGSRASRDLRAQSWSLSGVHALALVRSQSPSPIAIINAIQSTAILSYTSAPQFISAHCGTKHSEPNKPLKERSRVKHAPF